MEIGEKLEVNIDDLAFGGAGVFRVAGQVGFVPYVIPGEKVLVEVSKIKKKYFLAKKIKILKASPERILAPCEYYEVCGGCQYQHIGNEKELTYKVKQAEGLLKRIGGIDFKIENTQTGEQSYFYRNKITVETKITEDEETFNYKKAASTDLVAIKKCLLATEEINEALGEINFKQMTFLEKNGGKVSFRKSIKEVHVFPTESRTREWVEEDYENNRIKVGLNSFFQVNLYLVKKIIPLLKKWVAPLNFNQVVDAYCGCGFLSLFFEVPVFGFDRDKANVRLANENSRKLKKNHCYEVLGDEDKNFKSFWSRFKISFNQTLVILDPPRMGCGNFLLNDLLKGVPSFILYISCDGATLARDLKKLKVGELYRISQFLLLDFFPQTAHFESMVLLEKK